MDVSVFGPFKAYYAKAMNSRLLQEPGVQLTIYDIPALVKTARERAMATTSVISGLRKTGIFPFNSDIF